jgi:hypothetical protein
LHFPAECRQLLGKASSCKQENVMAFLSERIAVTALRWLARTMGTALLILIVAFAIGEGVPNPLRGSLTEMLCHVAMLTMFVGQIVAWKWEGIGGGLIVGGFFLFIIANHGVRLNAVFVPWPATGMLYQICWWRTLKAKELS